MNNNNNNKPLKSTAQLNKLLTLYLNDIGQIKSTSYSVEKFHPREKYLSSAELPTKQLTR